MHVNIPSAIMDQLFEMYRAGRTQRDMVELINAKYGDGTLDAGAVRRFFQWYAWLKVHWTWDLEKAKELYRK